MLGVLSTARNCGMLSSASPFSPPHSPGTNGGVGVGGVVAPRVARVDVRGGRIRSRRHRCACLPEIMVRRSISYAAVRELPSVRGRLRKRTQSTVRPPPTSTRSMFPSNALITSASRSVAMVTAPSGVRPRRAAGCKPIVSTNGNHVDPRTLSLATK